MKIILRFCLLNYFKALLVLLMVFGSILWLRPPRALELIDIMPSTYMARLWLLLLFNYLWSFPFILFDLWNEYRVGTLDLNVHETK